MRMLVAVLISFTTLLGIPSVAIAAEINLTDEVENIPAKVTDVYNCGHWANDKGAGYYRIVYVEWYYGCSLLYIQWMQDFSPAESQMERKVLYTLSIKEFNANDHSVLTFKKPKCVSTKDGIKLDIIANSGNDNKRHRFDVRVFSKFGKYSIIER